jgi:hypothetical protein
MLHPKVFPLSDIEETIKTFPAVRRENAHPVPPFSEYCLEGTFGVNQYDLNNLFRFV